MKTKWVAIPCIVVLVLIFLVTLTPFGKFIWASGNGLYLKLKVLNDVIRIVNDNYVDVPDWDKVMEGASRGIMESLDPHSVYISARKLPDINERFSGKFEGIGIEFDIMDGYITVIAPVAGSPSDRAGIQAGDKIVKINGESAYKITREGVVKKLRGAKGTKVIVTIRRHGVDDFDVTIIRDEIPIYSVTASFMIDDSTGYIFLNRFSKTSSDELENALLKLEKAGMKQLLLDLRNNGGGYLEQAVEVADKFISGKKMLVYTKGRMHSTNEEFYSRDDDHHLPFPLIILINRGSASASEIVAGAVQDLDRGLIVGETSFGKGLVQRQYSLRDGSAIRVTVARYYSPSGRLIQRPYGENMEDYYASFSEENRDSVLVADSTESRPIYMTVGGRVVYGGGGISPDYHIQYNLDISEETLTLLRHPSRVLFEFATAFSAENPEWSERKDEFVESFQINSTQFELFEQNVNDREIDVEFDKIEKDSDYIKILLKAEIAKAFWSYDEYYKIIREYDNQVTEAMFHFSEARRMVGSDKK